MPLWNVTFQILTVHTQKDTSRGPPPVHSSNSYWLGARHLHSVLWQIQTSARPRHKALPIKMVWGPEDGERDSVSGRLGFKKGFRRSSYLTRLFNADTMWTCKAKGGQRGFLGEGIDWAKAGRQENHGSGVVSRLWFHFVEVEHTQKGVLGRVGGDLAVHGD